MPVLVHMKKIWKKNKYVKVFRETNGGKAYLVSEYAGGVFLDGNSKKDGEVKRKSQ